MAEAVQVSRLTRRFGDFTAVDRVSFDVYEGEIFGFLGPNGAGKTTTIKMLNGLLRPTAGDARVAGFDVRTQIDEVKRNIGYMSQNFSLYPDLTVLENVQLFAGLYGVEGNRLDRRRGWVLEMARLGDYQDRLTGELPLGHKQRLALGCAVLHEPPILFLDEPTSGVDPISRRNFWDLIYGFAESGTTVFVSTHYMEEAEYCHRIAVMNRGSIIALDRPHSLKQAISEPILEVTTADAPRAVEVLRDAPGVLEVTMFGRAVHAMVEDQAVGERQIPEILAVAGYSVESIRPIEPSLEDVFVSFVHRSGGTVVG
ncbi:MAG: ATP-binding cassette domain-containing protein [Gemmatimonadetes bacterium]|nr:ATP-binding cassette domain-containing protein [Gemmatimonadota bacterium]NIO30556.1 ATP-binding cassette domain-containing protein [Gemmatimonadota bacterium]